MDVSEVFKLVCAPVMDIFPVPGTAEFLAALKIPNSKLTPPLEAEVHRLLNGELRRRFDLLHAKTIPNEHAIPIAQDYIDHLHEMISFVSSTDWPIETHRCCWTVSHSLAKLYQKVEPCCEACKNKK